MMEKTRTINEDNRGRQLSGKGDNPRGAIILQMVSVLVSLSCSALNAPWSNLLGHLCIMNEFCVFRSLPKVYRESHERGLDSGKPTIWNIDISPSA